MSRDPNQPRPVGNDGNLFKCPICKTLLGTDTRTFPFCSERCKMVDLNNWLNGTYQLSRPIDPTDELEDLPRSKQSNPPQADRDP